MLISVATALYDPRNVSRRLEENRCESATGLCCQRCDIDLEYCGVLTGKVVEDTYYFAERTDDGVCFDMDRRAGRLDVFGPGKSFRDTPECRKLVRDYSCLWWASQNDAYDNNCATDFADVPKRPCRSYCAQIAVQCANSLDYMDLCLGIACPPTEEDCEPGPEADTTQRGCYVWRYTTPHDAASRPLPSLLLLIAALLTTR